MERAEDLLRPLAYNAGYQRYIIGCEFFMNFSYCVSCVNSIKFQNNLPISFLNLLSETKL